MLEISKRKAEKRVVETEQPSRNWSGSRTLLDRFHGAEPLSVSLFLSLSLRSRENRGGFEGANGCLAWAEKLGTRRSRGQQLIAVGRESGRMENETWAEGMVEKWPIFQIWRGEAVSRRFVSRWRKEKSGRGVVLGGTSKGTMRKGV